MYAKLNIFFSIIALVMVFSNGLHAGVLDQALAPATKTEKVKHAIEAVQRRYKQAAPSRAQRQSKGSPSQLLIQWAGNKDLAGKTFTVQDLAVLRGFSETTVRVELEELERLDLVIRDTSHRPYRYRLSDALVAASQDRIEKIAGLHELQLPRVSVKTFPTLKRKIESILTANHRPTGKSELGDFDQHAPSVSVPKIRLYQENRVLVDDGYDWTKTLSANRRSFTLFHGTTSSLLQRIRKQGLVPDFAPILTEKDIRRFDRLIRRHNSYGQLWNFDIRQALNSGERTSLTPNFSIAVSHAKQGPEVLKYLLLDLDTLERRDLDEQDRHEVVQLREILNKIIRNSKPVILIIQTPIGPRDKLNGLGAKLLKSQEDLEEAVMIASGRKQYSGLLSHANCQISAIKGFNPSLSTSEIIERYVRENFYLVSKERVLPHEIVGVMEVSSTGSVADSIVPFQIHETSL